MWVVKIGGSLESAPGLRSLLALLVECGRSDVVIVPGGGRFAERVRAGQRVTGMDDVIAHHRAILAMEEYGAILCGVEPRLYPVANVNETTGAAATAPVWFPARMLSARADIPASWQVTSDSLALWLAGELNAEALVLVKSAPNGSASARELAATGYLDEYFPQLLQKTGPATIACIGIDEQEVLQQALTTGTISPTRRVR